MLFTSNNIKEITYSIKQNVKNDTALISIGEHTDINIESLISTLNAEDIKFMGGVFPKIIFNNSLYESGIVVETLYNVIHLSLIKNISEMDYPVPPIVFNDSQDYSVITYVDGLTSNISNYLSRLYENYGMKTNYFGGGAGSLSLVQKNCIFSKDGFFKDAAVMCVMEMKSNIGVKHGWKKLEGPFIVTKANRNTVEEINWKNPFEIYKTIVETDSNLKFTGDNFFELAKGYPLGIIKQGSSHIIRDPLIVNEKGELVCVGEVEENTLINIMKGDSESLIHAAKEAAKESLMHAKNPKTAIVIDCISRVLYLEDNFTAELENISTTIHKEHPNLSISGALTLGEISSYGNGFIEFYNKTIVIGLFE